MTAAAGILPANAAVKAPAPVRVRPSTVSRAGLFVWVPVFMGMGIGFWFLLPGLPGWRFYAIIAVICAILLTLARLTLMRSEQGRLPWQVSDTMRMLAWAACCMAAGAGLIGWRTAAVEAPVMKYRYYGAVEGRVVEISRSGSDRMRLTLDRVRLANTSADRTPDKVRISLMQDDLGQLPEPGRRVALTAHLGPPPGPASPDSFDFRSMSWYLGIGAVGYARTPIMTLAPPEPGGVYALHRLRMDLSQAMQDRIGGQAGAVASALMTGDRSGIEERTNEIMRASNLYHIISISGLHMSMIAGFTYAACRYLMIALAFVGLSTRWPAHKYAAVGALIVSGCYLWLSGGGVATERSFLMVAVMFAAILVDRRAMSLRTIAVSAVIILIYSPEGLLNPGFQMSYAATAALILLFPPWSKYAQHLPWIIRPAAMLILSSCIAGMVTSPIAAAHFSRMAQYGILANLLVVPVVGVLVMPQGVMAAVLAPFGLEGPMLWMMGLGTRWMLFIGEWVAGLHWAETRIPMPPSQVLPLLAVGATVCVLTVRRGGWRRNQVAILSGVMIAIGFVIWVTAKRPLVLIAPEGDAMGIMTAQGRVMSKPKGGSFVASNWLVEDGDTADQEQSAQRPLWSGPTHARTASLPGSELTVVHLTGTKGPELLEEYCKPGNLVVINSAVESSGSCILFDLNRLRQTGAIAIDVRNGELRPRTVAETAGRWPWT